MDFTRVGMASWLDGPGWSPIKQRASQRVAMLRHPLHSRAGRAGLEGGGEKKKGLPFVHVCKRRNETK